MSNERAQERSTSSERAQRRSTKAALVTGASSGIGRAIAVEIARRFGPIVVTLVGRKQEALEETASACSACTASHAGMAGDGHEGGAHCLALDLASGEGLDAIAERIGDGLDVLVHSAALYASSPLLAATAESWDAMMNTNVRAPALLTARLLPALRRARGDVVFVNSSAAFAPGANLSAYAASKAALRALADSLRAEENASGVRVLSVYPGRTATPMQALVHAGEGREYRPELLLQPEDVARVVVDTLSLPRTAEVTDVQVRPFVKSR